MRTAFTERTDYDGEMFIDNDSGKVEILLEDEGSAASFYADAFDVPMIAFALLGEYESERLPIPPSDVSDDVLLDIARGALQALKQRREAVAVEEKERKTMIDAMRSALGGGDNRLLASKAPLPEQLYNLGFRIDTAEAAK